jgi:uncharacterized protein (TIGR02996 family)
MSEQSAFVEAIRANPQDVTTRLIYADWLEERGDARGEYLRLEVELENIYARLQALQRHLDWEWVTSLSKPSKVQLLPAPTRLPRVETGAVQFGDDWPALFIRGDNAHSLMMWIQRLAEWLADHPNPDVADALHQLMGYADIIQQDVMV